MNFFMIAIFLICNSLFASEKQIVLNKDNTVVLRGPVTSSSVGDVMQKLSELNKKGESTDPIYLVLQTPGGSVVSGLNLIEYMNSLRRPVFSVANFAASMGFHILENSPKRYITKYGTIMSHRASGGFQGDIPQQVKSRFKHITDLLEKMDEQVISRTAGKFNKKSYSELIRDEYWAVGSNAIADGFADEVVTLKCDESLDGVSSQSISTIFGPVSASFSNCPLITEPLNADASVVQSIKEALTSVKNLEM